MRRAKGFTLLELLVVVAIIGILAAIAIPNLLTAIQRSKQRRTMVDMRNLATAWEARNVESTRYNAAGVAAVNGIEGCDQPVDMSALTTMLAPTYIKSFPLYDGWGTKYQAYTNQAFGSASARADHYALLSAGKDLKVESDPTTGPFTNFDCDIIYSNGMFISYPDGLTFNK